MSRPAVEPPISLPAVAAPTACSMASPVARTAPGAASLWRPNVQAVRVPQHLARPSTSWIGAGGDRQDPPARRRPPEPDSRSSLQWLADRPTLLVKLAPYRAGPPARCIVGRRRAGIHGEKREESTARPAKQHLLDPRHAGQQARRGPVRLLTLLSHSRSSTPPLGVDHRIGKPERMFPKSLMARPTVPPLVTAIRMPYSTSPPTIVSRTTRGPGTAPRLVLAIAHLPLAERVPIRRRADRTAAFDGAPSSRAR